MEKAMNSSERVLDLMTMLIGTNTENPGGNELVLAEKIVDYLHLDKSEYRLIEFGKNRADLIIDVAGRNNAKATAFVGHLDTVTAGDESLWDTSPFKAVLKNNYIYGRGASDMKGGIAAMMLLYERLKKAPPENPVKLIFTADEEKDGQGITAALDRKEFDNVSEMIICEPTSLEVGICEKGAIWLKFSVYGVSCHAANPTKGVNALESAFSFLNGLKTVVENASAEDELLGKNSFQTTQISSGRQINIIPESAVALVDLRTVPVPANSNDDVLMLIKKYTDNYCAAHDSVRIKYELLGNRESIWNDRNSGNIKKICKALDKIGLPTKISGISYFTDGSLVVPKTGLPFAIIGPGTENECHRINEKAPIEYIKKASDLYYNIVK